MDNTNEQRIISFCAGGRMLDMGLERVIPNLRTVAAVEIEAFAAFNLAAAVEKGVVAPFPIWTDIKTFPSAAFYGKIHGVTGGYPCPPFSAAGKRKGKADPRHLWPYFERHIGTIRPLWGFFENVEGHISLGFDEVQESLYHLGYTVEAGIYSAAEMGATQVRERLFILAATDIRELWYSVAKHQGYGIQPIPKRLGRGTGTELEQSSKAVDNAICIRKRGLPLGAQSKNSGFNRNGKNVANSSSLRSRESQPHIPSRIFNQDGLKWPSPPGHAQHEWEAPRIVKPGVGCTIDGYNFRADILRMLGNGVVPPVATHAFLDLFNKQCKNFALPEIHHSPFTIHH